MSVCAVREQDFITQSPQGESADHFTDYRVFSPPAGHWDEVQTDFILIPGGSISKFQDWKELLLDDVSPWHVKLLNSSNAHLRTQS